jgi:hypothetical protein
MTKIHKLLWRRLFGHAPLLHIFTAAPPQTAACVMRAVKLQPEKVQPMRSNIVFS